MKFDFSRFSLLWSFYHPRMLKFWMVTCAALILAYIGLCINYHFHSTLGFPIFSAIFSYVCYGAPMVFAIGRNRALEFQLPVTAAERLSVFAIFCFIVAPLGLSLFWQILESIGHAFGLPTDIQTLVNKIYTNEDPDIESFLQEIKAKSSYFIGLGILGNVPPLFCGLWAAVTARKNPIMSTIFGLFIGLIVIALVAMFGGICSAMFYFTPSEVSAIGTAPEPEAVSLAMNFVRSLMFHLVLCLAVLGLLTLVIGLPLMYRKIKRMQIIG